MFVFDNLGNFDLLTCEFHVFKAINVEITMYHSGFFKKNFIEYSMTLKYFYLCIYPISYWLINDFDLISSIVLCLQVNFSEQSLGQTTLVKDIPPRDDAAPGSGMSLPPTPDSSDRMHSSHLDLEPLSASD